VFQDYRGFWSSHYSILIIGYTLIYHISPITYVYNAL
jgi:hypothetical protein